MTVTVDPKRLARVQAKSLKAGSHDSWSKGACVMEAVAYVAGEPWSDHPECVCPVIGAFLRVWNDGLPSDAERDRLLKPLIPLVLNTRNPALAERRSLMAADWLVRTHTVAWVRLAKLDASADALAALPEITEMAQIPSMRGPIEAARHDAQVARAAARAARDAAWAAAWDAAWAVARAAARAARDAAWAAAGDALEDTQAILQLSAVELVQRMCALTDGGPASVASLEQGRAA
jgi:hypothetical protein